MKFDELKPNTTAQEGGRLGILDGFRTLAIFSVILFHFFSRWTPPFEKTSSYPYGSSFNYFSLGYLGVHLFFIISGFVIVLSLNRTQNFIVFWIKRIIRLLPSMILATLLTFIVFRLFDKQWLFPESHSSRNVIASISFISPSLFNNLGIHVANINGSYWSLWPEIQFYLFSSIIYFINKKKFIRNFILCSLICISLNAALYFIVTSSGIELPCWMIDFYYGWILDCFNLPEYLPLFGLGILFYSLFQDKIEKRKSSWVKFTATFLFMVLAMREFELSVYIYGVMLFEFALFFLFIYKPHYLGVFELKWITRIGRSSYFLYLIHENAGVLLISFIGITILPLSILATFVLILLFIVFSILVTEYIDKPISNWLKKKMVR